MARPASMAETTKVVFILAVGDLNVVKFEIGIDEMEWESGFSTSYDGPYIAFSSTLDLF